MPGPSRHRALLFFALLLAAAPARAQDTAASQAHFDKGSRLYQQGRYDDAFDELNAGYQMDPRPEFLYSLGQTQRKRGHCKEALDYYQRFLDSGLSRERASAVLVQMDRCRAELAHPAPAPAPAPAAPPTATVTPASSLLIASAPPPPRRPIYKRWWVWTTVAVVVAAGVGLGVGLGLSNSNHSDFKPTLPEIVLGK